MGRMRTRLTLFLIAGATWALGASGASAAPITLGDPLTTEKTQNVTTLSTGTVVQKQSSEGALISPVDGVILRWRLGFAVGGPFRLRVLTPGAPDQYTATGTSGNETPKSQEIETFPTLLAVKKGQTIGLDVVAGSKFGFHQVSEGKVGVWGSVAPALEEGAPTTVPSEPTQWSLLFNADIQPAPSIASLGPASGSISGGTAVTITGADFAGVRTVKFGGVVVPATTVSESQIVVTSPPVTLPGAVDVSVTTVAGESAAAKFTYEACIVPKVKARKTKGARTALQAAGCKLGKVKRQRGAGKAAKVFKQSSAPGTVLPPGSAITVKVR